MTETFDCPKCGAPLSSELHPGEETVVCPYCSETVIIPAELRIPLPRAVVQRQPPPPPVQTKRTSWVLIASILVIIVGICVTISVFLISSNHPTADNTATINSGSATDTVAAQATDEALQPILKLEQSWPASFVEPFTDNSNKWSTGDVRDSYITGNRSIISGTYTWNVTTVQSASDFSSPNMPEQHDFYASVDVKLVSMPDDADADAGMILRDNDTDQTWYYFSVNDQGQYYFGWYDGTNWYTLIPETDSSAIHTGQTNRLTVGAQGSQFIFLINNQLVDHFIDDHLSSGIIGVGVNLPQTGEKAIVEFSNFKVSSASAP